MINYDISEELEFGESFQHPSFNFTILLRNPERIPNLSSSSKKYYCIINNINGLANQYRGGLNVSVNDEKGSILSLSITGQNKMQISDYLNKLCEVYIRSNLEEKNRVSVNTIRFIDEQLSGIVDSLESAGIRLQNFRSANKVIDISKEGNFPI